MKLVFLLLLGIYIGAARCITQKGPKIGSLWDCEKFTNKQVHVIPTVTEWKEDFLTTKTKLFRGEVRKYKKEISDVDMYFCIAERIDKICIEGFLGLKGKIRKRVLIRVSVPECTTAMMTKRSTYDKLYREHKTHGSHIPPRIFDVFGGEAMKKFILYSR